MAEVKFKMGEIAQIPNVSLEDEGTILFALENNEKTGSICLAHNSNKYPIIDRELNDKIRGTLVQNATELINIAPQLQYSIIHNTNPHGFMGLNQNGQGEVTYSIYNARLNNNVIAQKLSYDNHWFGFFGKDDKTLESSFNTIATPEGYRGHIKFTTLGGEFENIEKIIIHYNTGATRQGSSGDKIRPPKQIYVTLNGDTSIISEALDINHDYGNSECLSCSIDVDQLANEINLFFIIDNDAGGAFIFISEIEILTLPREYRYRSCDGLQTQVQGAYDALIDANKSIANASIDLLKQSTDLFCSSVIWENNWTGAPPSVIEDTIPRFIVKNNIKYPIDLFMIEYNTSAYAPINSIDWMPKPHAAHLNNVMSQRTFYLDDASSLLTIAPHSDPDYYNITWSIQSSAVAFSVNIRRIIGVHISMSQAQEDNEV